MADIDPVAGERAIKLFESLVRDKKLGKDVRAKASELFPDVQFAEDDIVDSAVAPLREEIAAISNTLKEEREARAKEKEEADNSRSKRNLESALDGARNKYNLTEDGFDKMVARMKDTGNYSDAEAAAAWVAQQTPPPARVNKADWMPMRIGQEQSLRENEDLMNLLHKDPQGFELHMLNEFVNDPDGFTRAAGMAA